MNPSLPNSEVQHPVNEIQATEGRSPRRRTAQLFSWLRRQRRIKLAKRGLVVILWLHGVDLAQIETSTGMPAAEIETWIERYRRRSTRGLEAQRRANAAPTQSLSVGDPAKAVPAEFETIEEPNNRPLALQPSTEDPVLSPPPAGPAETTIGGGTAQSLWLELEPADPNDPAPAEVCEAMAGNAGWMLVGASYRGRQHRHEAKYREDAYKVAVADEWHIAAVADGAGSAPLARVGAQLATEAAVTKLVEDLPYSELRETTVRDILAAAAEHARQALQAEAHTRQTAISAFATTLLIVTHRVTENGHWAAVFQVGDGTIAGCAADGRVIQFGRPDQGEFAGETQFLTHLADAADIHPRIHILGELPPDIGLVMSMTDGVADDFHPPERDLPLLIGHVRTALQAGRYTSAHSLLTLLGYKKKGSFDDRTLA